MYTIVRKHFRDCVSLSTSGLGKYQTWVFQVSNISLSLKHIHVAWRWAKRGGVIILTVSCEVWGLMLSRRRRNRCWSFGLWRTCRWVPTFRRNTLPRSSSLTMEALCSSEISVPTYLFYILYTTVCREECESHMFFVTLATLQSWSWKHYVPSNQYLHTVRCRTQIW